MSHEEQELKLTDRGSQRTFIDEEDLDFMFQFFLALQQYGGASLGEMFNVSRRIDPTDQSSWETEFVKEAQRVEEIAEGCLEKGHRVSASDAFLRAHTLYRAAYVAVTPETPSFVPVYRKSVECFEKSMKLKPFPAEFFDIPDNGFRFHSCLVKPDNSGKRRPTVMVICGGESHLEDHYFMLAKGAIERGYNAFLWEGPYDVNNRHYNPTWTARTYDGPKFTGTYRKAFDTLAARPDVDPDRIILTGDSYGGAKALVIATAEDRFAAVIPNSPMVSQSRVLLSTPLPKAYGGTPEESAALQARLPFSSRVTLQRVTWAHGLDSLTEWIPLMEKNFIVDLPKIEMPFMALYSESEAGELQRQAEEAYDGVGSKVKTIRMTSKAEGADFHCQANNLALANQVKFDWLDEVLGYDGTV